MPKHNLIPLVFLFLGTTLSLLLGRAVDDSHREALALETQITSEQIIFRLDSCIESREAVVRRLAQLSWQNQQQLENEWSDTANTLVNLFPGIQALNHVDNNWNIDIVLPQIGNSAAIDANLHNHPEPSIIENLQLAEESGELTRTDVVELLQGGRGFVLYQKIISANGEHLGFANGVFRNKDLIDTCLSEQELQNRFSFKLTEPDGTPVYERIHPGHYQPWAFHVNSLVFVSGRPWNLEFAPTPNFIQTRSQGLEDLWVYIGILLVFLIAAATRGMLIKQVSLSDNQERYRLLVENQSDMVIKVDSNGAFLYVSPSYCRTFGKSEHELVGTRYLPLVHEEDRPMMEESLHSISPNNPHSYHEQRALTKDGFRWIAWSNTGIFDKDARLEAITAVGRDVTDVKTLKDSVAHTQKMQAIGEIASSITHDFNNLLQVMMANIEFLMRESSKSESTYKYLEKLQRVIERGKRLIAKLSTLSKQEILLPSEIELNEFVPELVDMFQQTLPETVSLSHQAAHESLCVSVDVGQLERVILNILVNAKDSIKDRGKIEVSLQRLELDKASCSGYEPPLTPGIFARIDIKDNGSGIPQELLSRIFDPFFSTKNNGDNSGLGLANSYSIVRQHNGIIQVESNTNNGTVFSIYLPVVIPTVKEMVKTDNSKGASQQESRQLVLVVDDEPELLELTCQMLEASGFKTLRAANGQEALRIHAEHGAKITLTILDLVMPVMSGQQAAIEIKKLDETARILFISGYVPQTNGHAILLDAPLLKKPFKGDYLIEKVKSLIV